MSSTNHLSHILLLGIPRTGSTWLSKILSATTHYNLIHEPDNERHNFFGYYGKQGLPRYPILTEDDVHNRYKQLFHYAFYQPYITYNSYSNQLLKKWIDLQPEKVEKNLRTLGFNEERNLMIPYVFAHMLPKQIGNRHKRVVKSVHAILATRFLLHYLEVNPVIIIRHPAGVLASMLRMHNPDIDRKLEQTEYFQSKFPFLKLLNTNSFSLEKRAGLQTALLYSEIADLINEFSIPLIFFEELSSKPFLQSHKLYETLGIEWNDDVELFIANSNKQGSGYATNRISHKQATKWKKELTSTQIDELMKGYKLISTPFYT